MIYYHLGSRKNDLTFLHLILASFIKAQKQFTLFNIKCYFSFPRSSVGMHIIWEFQRWSMETGQERTSRKCKLQMKDALIFRSFSADFKEQEP
ncbi:MAG: hypothetical protein B1H11_01065 [Desulfobacteraceae bacterium 4484_190.1]|nr:MAG: hypothetical protein B1H11_01065 [Desulfobacteraceae bacterium 4484_190.1]